MTTSHILIKKSPPLNGTVQVRGAKNAVLVILTSLVLTEGVSVLANVPNNADVQLMIRLLEELGATCTFDTNKKELTVDTFGIYKYEIRPDIMNKMRASILVMGPLLARFGKARVALPGGDLIGARPINYHLDGFKKLGVVIDCQEPFVNASSSASADLPHYRRIVLEYPSVGATENLMMFATLYQGQTVIINAALEPEVLDLIDMLKKMGAQIEVQPGATIVIQGVQQLNPVTHTIIPDRLEVASLLLATAITGGSITIPDVRPDHLDIVLEKIKEMGHKILTNFSSQNAPTSITLEAVPRPKAISIKTGPYPAFPTDLQAIMMANLCLAEGISTIEETVYENRMIHVKELGKMGAQISLEGNIATIRGVDALYGCEVIASDVRASCSLVLAGLAALGQTKMTGVGHWQRGYDKLEEKISHLGGLINLVQDATNEMESLKTIQTLL